MAAGLRSVFLLFGLAASAAVAPPPPPPPPGVPETSGGGLTPPQIARLRGWQAPPRRPAPDADETDDHARGEAPAGDGTRQGAAESVAPTLTPALDADPGTLRATARGADPGPDWAPTLALAALDLARRQAAQQAAADEEALLLMLVLVEVL